MTAATDPLKTPRSGESQGLTNPPVSVTMGDMKITTAQIEAAARKLAHFMDFNEAKWEQYAEITKAMLEAAEAAREQR